MELWRKIFGQISLELEEETQNIRVQVYESESREDGWSRLKKKNPLGHSWKDFDTKEQLQNKNGGIEQRPFI